MLAQLTAPSERSALTRTIKSCAYLGLGVPLLLSAIGGDAGLAAPLAGLTVVATAVAVLLAQPPSRRLAVSAAVGDTKSRS